MAATPLSTTYDGKLRTLSLTSAVVLEIAPPIDLPADCVASRTACWRDCVPGSSLTFFGRDSASLVGLAAPSSLAGLAAPPTGGTVWEELSGRPARSSPRGASAPPAGA